MFYRRSYANILLVQFMTSFLDIMVSPFQVTFLCVHVSLWIFHHDFCPLRNLYTWECYYIALTSSFLPTIFLIWLAFGGIGKNLICECLSYLISSSCTHILWIYFGLKFVLISLLIIIYIVSKICSLDPYGFIAS